MRIKKTLLEIALDTPSKPGCYGYLHLDERVDEELEIINNFNTFAEIFPELEIYSKNCWHLSEDQQMNNFVTYMIVGNGFLRKVRK